jgi:hypothetical protein
MANATVLSIGQVNGGGATDALFLKVYGGEVMTAFAEATVTEGRHMQRSISQGKSAQFPATWKVTAAYHTPGVEIVGQTSNVNERVITIDDLLVSSVFIPNIDEAKNHFDYRSIYSTETGLQLAYKKDSNVLQVGILAARAAATVTGAYGGSSLNGANFKTVATDLAAGIYAGVQAMDEKDIPESDTKHCFVKPAQYYLLAQSTALINRDWLGAGSYSDGKILRIGGADIVKTNRLPTTNVNSGPAAYQVNATNTAFLMMTDKAVGTVKLMDLGVESAYDIRRQGTLILAKYAVGHGILRPECAVEGKTS